MDGQRCIPRTEDYSPSVVDVRRISVGKNAPTKGVHRLNSSIHRLFSREGASCLPDSPSAQSRNCSTRCRAVRIEPFDKIVLVSVLFLPLVGEDRGGIFDHGFLSLSDDIRMDFVLRGELVDRLYSPDRFKSNPALLFGREYPFPICGNVVLGL